MSQTCCRNPRDVRSTRAENEGSAECGTLGVLEQILEVHDVVLEAAGDLVYGKHGADLCEGPRRADLGLLSLDGRWAAGSEGADVRVLSNVVEDQGHTRRYMSAPARLLLLRHVRYARTTTHYALRRAQPC